MMHPKYERLCLLAVAAQEAAHDLDDPIDRIEVVGPAIIATARGRRVVMTYGYEDSFDAQGSPILGGGSWSVRRIGGGGAGGGLLSRLFGRAR